MLAMACLDHPKRRILYPRWSAIDAGATLSDEFRIMWERDDLKLRRKSLVHRYFVDSSDPKDHGCVIRALDYSEGAISFIRDYQSGKLGGEGGWDEIQFLEDLGMFLGVASHHIADLCTPVHVGHNIDLSGLGFKTWKKFHSKVEKDIERYAKTARLEMRSARAVKLSRGFFRGIAEQTYKQAFQKLTTAYGQQDRQGLIDIVSWTISSAVMYTRDVWHTILTRTRMTQQEWSLQPLL